MAGILNYLVGALVLIFMVFRLRAKSLQDPTFKIGGIGVKSLLNFAYIGAACYVILILMLLSD